MQLCRPMQAALLNGLLIGTLSFSAAADNVRMMGAGNVSCQEWEKLRATSAYFSAGNWILGFLSSTAWTTGVDILAAKSTDFLFTAVDEFCLANPKLSISEAAVELSYYLLDNQPAK